MGIKFYLISGKQIEKRRLCTNRLMRVCMTAFRKIDSGHQIAHFVKNIIPDTEHGRRTSLVKRRNVHNFCLG